MPRQSKKAPKEKLLPGASEFTEKDAAILRHAFRKAFMETHREITEYQKKNPEAFAWLKE